MTQCLAVFDVDGTLTQTSAVDDACYQEAIRLEWGVVGVSTDWGAYQHSTDNAIATEISRVHRGRDATLEELAAMRERFFGLVRAAAETRPQLFEQVPGASSALEALPPCGWRVAIATGGWTPSAKLKLAQAGVPLDGIPAAFACDAHPREEIIRIAVSRAEAAYGTSFQRVVYVGDGVWDVRAASRLGIGFVGIASGERESQLRHAGAARVVADYRNFEQFAAALAACMKSATR